MKIIFTIILFVIGSMVLPLAGSAQDTIVKKNGDEIQAKVLEIGDSLIKYKEFKNVDGPTFTVNKSDVFMIKYLNGTKDVFYDEEKSNTNNFFLRMDEYSTGRKTFLVEGNTLRFRTFPSVHYQKARITGITEDKISFYPKYPADFDPHSFSCGIGRTAADLTRNCSPQRRDRYCPGH